MERERWRGAQFLGWVGLLTGAKTTVAGGGGIEPWDLQTVPGGDKNVKQGATALPWQVLGRLSHALSSTRSSLVPRTEPAAGKQCQEFPEAGSATAFHFDCFPTNLSLAPVKCCAGN